MYHNRKLKPFVIPALYSIAFIAFFISLFYLKNTLSIPVSQEEDNDQNNYVSEEIINNVIPTVGETKEVAFIRPYNDESIKLIKNFYDKDSESSKQVNSIIYYENTYMQNSGVDYAGKANFEVLSIYEGTVSDVKEDKLLGKIIEIRHSNELISVYQSLSEVMVKKGDKVEQKQVIGKSGSSVVGNDLNDYLHLEVIYNGKLIDPETIYDKTLKDL